MKHFVILVLKGVFYFTYLITYVKGPYQAVAILLSASNQGMNPNLKAWVFQSLKELSLYFRNPYVGYFRQTTDMKQKST